MQINNNDNNLRTEYVHRIKLSKKKGLIHIDRNESVN
jgi:hypothetical protein